MSLGSIFQALRLPWWSFSAYVGFEKWNQYPSAGVETVEISKKLSEDLLLVMGKVAIPA